MASQGANYPSSITEAGTGVVWTNPANAAGAPNAAVASIIGLTNVQNSKILLGGPSGLGFAIPAGSTIDGVAVTVRCKAGITGG